MIFEVIVDNSCDWFVSRNRKITIKWVDWLLRIFLFNILLASYLFFI